MKKWIPVFLVFLIGAAAGIQFVLPGFQKRTDVCLQDFAVSDDSSVMTVKTGLFGSMGFIRAIEASQTGPEIHCSFYCAFGGLNSSFGAENTFEIPLEDSSERIYFDRGGEPDVLVLERDAETHTWAPPYSHLPQS